MNQKLPIALLVGFALLGGIFVVFTPSYAVSIAEQTQGYDSSLNVWQAIQELGDNLSGTAESFTFRVSTSRTNLNQFDHTASNTKIYDKTTNTTAIPFGCIPPESSPNDPLRGLTFTTADVPAGYEDVTIDFSCHNYNFIPGHRYLIFISNANMGNSGSGLILFGSANYSGNPDLDYFSGGGVRYANGNPFDYRHNSGSCNPVSYIWNDQTQNPVSGCNIFGSAKSDLYFVLNNNSPPPPPPRLPVIFIPGIGGSELKATQDIIWSAPDGHGGTYSNEYSGNEKIWVNQTKAAMPGNDDYFDVLRLKPDGITPEADLSLTGDLVSDGYSQIDSFFADMGYTKGTNYFVFPYDWRKDVRHTKDILDALIESAKTASGQSQVNLVVHSMGGLVARYYISDPTKAAKVNKLIELGVPHLGAVDSLKTLMYGSWLGYDFRLFHLGIPPSATKDVFQNLPSGSQLLPSNKYFDFYDNSNNETLYPFKDDRDIDNNNIVGALNFNQTKSLLMNLNYNATVLGMGEDFHNLDTILNQTNNVIVYVIVGTAQPTLGQIFETWWITWPINLFNKTDEIFINGDGTVPLYSAALISETLNISGAMDIYYVDQNHGELVKSNGAAMQTVKAILNDDNSLPVEVKSEKIYLEGEQISLDDGELDLYDDQNRHCGLNDNGEMEEDIPDVVCTTSGNTKHAFVKKKAAKVKVRTTRKNPATSSKTTSIKKRTYRQDTISKTVLYKDIIIPQVGKIQFDLDPSLDISPSLTLYQDETTGNTSTITPTSEVSGSTATDQTSPSTSVQVSGTKNDSGIYTGPVTITLTGSDNGAGILRIEYSLDSGRTVQTYTGPFIISTPGTTTLQIKAIDKLGNEEIPQTIIIQIAAPTSITSNTTSGSNSSDTISTNDSPVIARSEATKQSSNSISSQPDVLGVTFKDPSEISDQINKENLLNQQNNLTINENTNYSVKEILGGLLLVSGSVVSFASLSLFSAFFKQIKYKM